MMRRAVTVLAVGAALVLTGCSTQPTATPLPAGAASSTTTPAASAAATAPAASAAATAPAGTSGQKPAPATSGIQTCQVSCGDNPQYNGPANLPAPSWAAGDKDAALEAAVAAMGAYIKPGTDHGTWFEGIHPRITDQFAIELGKFDPAYLTVSKMTGTATATTDPNNPFQVVVGVPTDDGVYQVTMLRSTQTAFWLANSIVPPLPGNK
ncbi:hypothetical protein IV498_10270 [Paenarthrobacter sp. Z7-10]|uniref:hypothetical protein n=1 Tax=Paenarthrobacter sp. Z7-10 TaxID=2787635 RepID=UPI0022A95E82|nr:hypothetical protein [Paenarthrobacter sp. Z7-10]MCZ2403555.1 hypothetical protein [Paenarthrobacter sp. Z7-10]